MSKSKNEKVIINFDEWSDNDAFLQKDNFEKVKQILEDHKSKNQNKYTTTTNNIFINAKRGEGKTHFLQNIEENIENKEFYFFKSLDPSLLHDNENFLTIILANILNKIQNKHKNKKPNSNIKKEKKFYDLLNKIAIAIDGIILNNNQSKNTLQTISQDQTSLKLQNLLNKFFKKVIKILGVKHLVLLIDDIDMAIDKGFEVLETIRKYLNSQYIATVITGDFDQYKILIENNFDNLFKKEKDNNIRGILSDNYLIKIFPQQDRININRMSEYINADKKDIIFRINSQDINLKDFYTKFGILTHEFFNNPIRNIVQFSLGEIKHGKILNTTFENIELKYSLRFTPDYIKIKGYLVKTEAREALELIQQYIDKNIISEQLYIYKGDAHVLIKDYEDAINAYRKVIEINPKSYESHKKIGDVYDDYNNSYNNAILEYEKATNINPKYDKAYYNKGLIYEKKEEYDNALSSYEKVIGINPKDDKAHYSIGDVYFYKKEYDNAISSYEKVIGINPKDHRSYYKIGDAYYCKKDYSNAISFYKKAINIYPLDDYYDALQDAQDKQKNAKE